MDTGKHRENGQKFDLLIMPLMWREPRDFRTGFDPSPSE
jgi:hypothetical protein